MLNGKYKELVEQVKKAQTNKEILRDLRTIVCMVVTNDLPHLKFAIWVIVILMAADFFNIKLDLSAIFGLIGKLF